MILPSFLFTIRFDYFPLARSCLYFFKDAFGASGTSFNSPHLFISLERNPLVCWSVFSEPLSESSLESGKGQSFSVSSIGCCVTRDSSCWSCWSIGWLSIISPCRWLHSIVMVTVAMKRNVFFHRPWDSKDVDGRIDDRGKRRRKQRSSSSFVL